MARRLTAEDLAPHAWHSARDIEITLYAADAGPADAGASSLRRALQLPVSPRTWHRVFPVLPRETRLGGALVLWHPDEAGWLRALEWVHARQVPPWALRGAYVQAPDADLPALRDFQEFDELDLADWSLAVPDPSFHALCSRLRGERLRLSELVARWALEVGPQRAGLALSQRRAGARPSNRGH